MVQPLLRSSVGGSCVLAASPAMPIVMDTIAAAVTLVIPSPPARQLSKSSARAVLPLFSPESRILWGRSTFALRKSLRAAYADLVDVVEQIGGIRVDAIGAG